MANGEVNVYGALRAQTTEGKVAYASQLWDETLKKFQDVINQENANDGLVSAKVAQSFTTAQKTRARTNIGASSEEEKVENVKVLSEFLASLRQDIDNLKNNLGKIYDLRARKVMLDNVPDVASAPMKTIGQGAPSASVIPQDWDDDRYGVWTGVPRFVGQEYYDITNKKMYVAFSLTNSVGDWVLIN